MFKSKQQKYMAEEDAIRQELGCYINTDAVKDAALLSVERTHVVRGEGSERTLVTYFNHSNGSNMEYEFLISRADHKDLINKLKHIKQNEK